MPPRSSNFRGRGQRRDELQWRPGRLPDTLNRILDSPEVAGLVGELEGLRWTGRGGYPVRCLIGACLVKHLYGLPTWSETARLIGEHQGLREAVGETPSQWALYRFTRKLRKHREPLESCIDRVIETLRGRNPGLGEDVCLDSTDLPGYANGQRYVSKGGRLRERFSDPDASWGHRSAVSTRRGGGFYGYKLHLAACSKTGLPLAWEARTARDSDAAVAPLVLERLTKRGFKPQTAAMDKGYDLTMVYRACDSNGVLPVVPLRETPGVKAGQHLPPSCKHGEWAYAGTDHRRRRSKWRCPTRQCRPRSTWVQARRLHPLIPRHTRRWGQLYRARSAVEREFGRLKHRFALSPLRVRNLERVQLHTDLCLLTRLTVALLH